ncbi:hypothetical protein LIER_02375 [Lithospermum erythrorhizon]|uniref:Uncharacterized protein n=1 Tax=Lithospermum erythrorhizon TaxID=34254 RepID=A0AAV3NTU5_LITER
MVRTRGGVNSSGKTTKGKKKVEESDYDACRMVETQVVKEKAQKCQGHAMEDTEGMTSVDVPSVDGTDNLSKEIADMTPNIANIGAGAVNLLEEEAEPIRKKKSKKRKHKKGVDEGEAFEPKKVSKKELVAKKARRVERKARRAIEEATTDDVQEAAEDWNPVVEQHEVGNDEVEQGSDEEHISAVIIKRRKAIGKLKINENRSRVGNKRVPTNVAALVREFICSMTEDIDDPVSPNFQKVTFHNFTFDFSPSVINGYFARANGGDTGYNLQLSEIVKVLTGGAVNTWLDKEQILSSRLIVKYVVLHKIDVVNWVPTTHTKSVSDTVDWVLYTRIGIQMRLHESCWRFVSTANSTREFFISRDVVFYEVEFPFENQSCIFVSPTTVSNISDNVSKHDLSDDPSDKAHEAASDDQVAVQVPTPVFDLERVEHVSACEGVSGSNGLVQADCVRDLSGVEQIGVSSTCDLHSNGNHGNTCELDLPLPSKSSDTLYSIVNSVNCYCFSSRHRHFLAALTVGTKPKSFKESMADP